MSPIAETTAIELVFRLVLGVVSLALVYACVAPLLPGDQWRVRIFDFPRVQVVVVILLTLAAYVALHLSVGLLRWELGLLLAISVGLLWQLWSILPYTVLHPVQMKASPEQDERNRVSLLVYNVLYENREVGALRDLIDELDPDLILLGEPSQWWLEQLEGLHSDYPHTILQPQENKYGLLLFSRLELLNPEIRFLVEPEIPSLRSGVRLRSGQVITLYGVHPRPPGVKRPEAGEDEGEREDSDKRDAELLLVAKEVAELGDHPVIVGGDFNDVAWSRGTHLFQRVSGLLDPRVGRGLFNSFNATSRIIRYPLDHVFASSHFRLVALRRLPAIGSDHFPMLVVLDYDPAAVAVNDAPDPDADDEAKVQEAIDEGASGDGAKGSR